MNDISGVWSAPIDVLTNADDVRVMIRLSAVIDPETDILHVLWVDQWIKGGLHYSQVPLSQANNPNAWMKSMPLAVGTENGAIDVDKDGVLHVVYGTSGADNLEVGVDYIRSTDGGITWSTPIKVVSKKVAFPSDPYAEIAVDGNGRIHVGVTYRSQDYDSYSEVGYVRSIDGGDNWDEYELIDDLGTAWQGVHIMSPYTFGDNEIHLTWHDPRRMHRWSYDGGNTWSEPTEIMELGAAFGGPNALTKDAAGTIHMVTSINGGVYSASWSEGKWGAPERIENREIDPHGQEITICRGNRLQIVYDDRGDSQKIWYSNRSVDAPRLERKSIPLADPETEVKVTDESINSSALISAEEDSSPLPLEINIPENANQSPSNPLVPLLIASGIVVGIILIIFIIKLR
jgi:hypothetical protein